MTRTMRSQHMSSTAQALYSVFILPILSKSPLRRPALNQFSRLSPSPLPPNGRLFSHTPIAYAKVRAAEERTQKWNEEIQARLVRLVSTSTNTLSDPVSLWSTLRSFDHKTHRLIQVVPDEPDNPHFVPTCKIVSKKEMYDFEKRRKAAMKDAKKVAKLSGEAAMKTLELNWAIDVGNDLNHRMDRLREFLGEGRRVEIVLAAKKRGRKATTEECENVLRVIRETVDSVEGAKEREAFTGKLGGMMTGTFQGKPVKAGGHVEEPARDGEEE